jgi:hypothetical protein
VGAAKFQYGFATQAACQNACDAQPACIGYLYGVSSNGCSWCPGFCKIYGPGLDQTGGGWTAENQNPTGTNTIGGTFGPSGGGGTGQAFVCVAVAGRN